MEPASCYLFKSGIAIKPVLFIVLALLLASPAGSTDQSQTKWLDVITDQTWEFLGRNSERVSVRKDPDGHKTIYHLSKNDIKKVVYGAWEAAPLNPGWGNRRLTTIRLISAAYRESRFDFKAVRLTNKNGTIDLGLMQINSCNWFSGKGRSKWRRFCKRFHKNPNNLKLLFDPFFSMKYAAYLNQSFIKYHHKTLVFSRCKSQKKLYEKLFFYEYY